MTIDQPIAFPPAVIAPPFTLESATYKVRMSEDIWNSRDLNELAHNCTDDSVWRYRHEFIRGREQILSLLSRKWEHELNYRLAMALWGFKDNRMAVRIQFEWHDVEGRWYRSYGNELWEFNACGLMQRRESSINDIIIKIVIAGSTGLLLGRDRLTIPEFLTSSKPITPLEARLRKHYQADDTQLAPLLEVCLMPFETPNYLALTAMITPAVLLTANASLLISTTNRMARVVDRVRILNDKGDELCRGAVKTDYLPDRCAHVADQIARLEWRSKRVRFAVAALHLSFACFVGTSLVLALNALLGNQTVAVPTALSMTGVSLMFLASINLFREVRAALASSREEIRFYRDLRKRRVTSA